MLRQDPSVRPWVIWRRLVTGVTRKQPKEHKRARISTLMLAQATHDPEASQTTEATRSLKVENQTRGYTQYTPKCV